MLQSLEIQILGHSQLPKKLNKNNFRYISFFFKINLGNKTWIGSCRNGFIRQYNYLPTIFQLMDPVILSNVFSAGLQNTLLLQLLPLQFALIFFREIFFYVREEPEVRRSYMRRIGWLLQHIYFNSVIFLKAQCTETRRRSITSTF